MTVRSATLLFFVNALLSFGAIWLVQSFAPGLLWVPILVGSGFAWVLYYLAIRAARREKQQTVIEKRIATIEQEIATRRSKRARTQAIY